MNFKKKLLILLVIISALTHSTLIHAVDYEISYLDSSENPVSKNINESKNQSINDSTDRLTQSSNNAGDNTPPLPSTNDTINIAERDVITNTSKDMLSIENEFIKIIVNNQSLDKGRFSLETTQGAPQNSEDNNQLLIFGRPIPWTSYTTIQIDGKPFIFGGKDEKVSKRSGLKQEFGIVDYQRIEDERILTKTVFNDIEAIQELMLIRNPSTQVKDSALISYRLKNRSLSTSHNVGLRLMMDTKLGSNDGAPFRIGKDAITSEVSYSKNTMQDYWQTFDNLSSPNIVAQGTLRLEKLDIMPPDRLYLANWGTLVDHPWNYNYEKGRSFIRTGELDKDTALALYWDPVTLGPGEEKVIKTAYGLGGLSTVTGELTIGITAPAEASKTQKSSLLIVAYILNSGGFDSKNTKVEFNLPKGFTIVEGSKINNLDTLIAGQTKQIPIKINVQNANVGKQTITVKVTSSTLKENEISRSITIIGAPKLNQNIAVSSYNDYLHNEFYDVKVTLHNPNSIPILGLNSTLYVPQSLKLPFYEKKTKTIPRLNPNKRATLHWKVRGPIKDNTRVSVVSTSKSTSKVTRSATVKSHNKNKDVIITASEKEVSSSQHLFFTIKNNGLSLKETDTITIEFNDDYLDFIRLSLGETFINKNIPGNDTIEKNKLTLQKFNYKNAKKETLYNIHFYSKRSGKTRLKVFKNNILLAEKEINIK